jgi:hypothetical protein
MLCRMSTRKLALAITVCCFVACSQQEYVEAPPLPEPDEEQAQEPVDDSASEAEPSEEAEPLADESESDSAEPEAEPPPAPPPAPPRKPCSELPQKTCEITAGCVWSTTKKCIDE